jgi:hypothetical protein
VKVTQARIQKGERDLTGQTQNGLIATECGEGGSPRIEHAWAGHDGKGSRSAGRAGRPKRHIAAGLFVSRAYDAHPATVEGIEQPVDLSSW